MRGPTGSDVGMGASNAAGGGSVMGMVNQTSFDNLKVEPKQIQTTAGRFFSQLFTVMDAFKNKLGLASLSPFKMADLGGISAPPGLRGTNAGVMGNKGAGRSQ